MNRGTEGDAGAAEMPGRHSALGRVELYESRLQSYLDPAARPELLAGGLVWPEGPAWDSRRSCLYFSDIPPNRIYRWSETGGLQIFLAPAGWRPDGAAEAGVMPGTNGLLYRADRDKLLICDQTSRSVQEIALATGERRIIVSGTADMPLNSPNDLALAADGSIYFSDPPYGLIEGNASPARRRSINGVYRAAAGGEPELITGAMTYPNGLVLSPDQRTLYVSQSDYEAPLIRRFRLDASRRIMEDVLWYDMQPHRSDDSPGMPDGMALAEDGTMFATAPGGVLVIDAAGVALGRIHLGRATSNCCFGGDGSTLFITADKCLLRMPTRTRGSSLHMSTVDND